MESSIRLYFQIYLKESKVLMEAMELSTKFCHLKLLLSTLSLNL